MNVLVIGSGGREHAIVKKFRQATSVSKIYVAPGNDGMYFDATCVPIEATDIEALLSFAKEKEIDLTFVGPEQALSEGIVDAFQSEELVIFGPTKAAAMLESSKSFAKDFMKKYDIPTAAYETFESIESAKQYADMLGAPCVIKADGLAAGKGVVVAESLEEAHAAIDEMLGQAKFGDASSKIVIEEFLDGQEFSFMSFVHQGHIYPMPIAQDHKRALDGDEGPNTGGMGAYSPVPQISEELIAKAHETVVVPTVQAMEKEGTPFTGVLYAGLIATTSGPKVIEFNVRFGDPETQVVLPRLTSDFGAFLQALLREEEYAIEWSDKARLGIVIAAKGYPEKAVTGYALPSLESEQDDVELFFAGVKNVQGRFESSGGRVLLVSGIGDTLEEAKKSAYRFVENREWDGFHYRKDIGWRVTEN
ncbi:phosphoribosylamine--glycine ligase [Paenisporosarcina cavernae]|uniref:Phosphoribosylamine--glycine ligase n=1 Tax=Paenisporosarcina cavernae TaxID=2320858 RepID=A0A385YUE6_9BACL|nr:phosphoribosylamine--glycine ligase [Paenisporosarcina cavernae]AYC30306.1 phosphoribosylamine--glycine ligase [Paenisporosarcina cavernae]